MGGWVGGWVGRVVGDVPYDALSSLARQLFQNRSKKSTHRMWDAFLAAYNRGQSIYAIALEAELSPYLLARQFLGQLARGPGRRFVCRQHARVTGCWWGMGVCACVLVGFAFR